MPQPRRGAEQVCHHTPTRYDNYSQPLPDHPLYIPDPDCDELGSSHQCRAPSAGPGVFRRSHRSKTSRRVNYGPSHPIDDHLPIEGGQKRRRQSTTSTREGLLSPTKRRKFEKSKILDYLSSSDFFCSRWINILPAISERLTHVMGMITRSKTAIEASGEQGNPDIKAI